MCQSSVTRLGILNLNHQVRPSTPSSPIHVLPQQKPQPEMPTDVNDTNTMSLGLGSLHLDMTDSDSMWSGFHIILTTPQFELPNPTAAHTNAADSIKPEASIPQDATILQTENGNFCKLLELRQHSKIHCPPGRIIMAIVDFEDPVIKQFLQNGGQKALPSPTQEAIDQGICLLWSHLLPFWSHASLPSAVFLSNYDSVILRHKYGSGEEKDDVVVFPVRDGSSKYAHPFTLIIHY